MGTVAPVQSDREIRKNMAQSAQVNESQSGSWHAVSRVATFWLRVALTLAGICQRLRGKAGFTLPHLRQTGRCRLRRWIQQRRSLRARSPWSLCEVQRAVLVIRGHIACATSRSLTRTDTTRNLTRQAPIPGFFRGICGVHHALAAGALLCMAGLGFAV